MAKIITKKHHPDTTEKRDMTNKDIDFIQQLQQEINTQDTEDETEAVYWTIEDYQTISGKDLDNPESIVIYESRNSDEIIMIIPVEDECDSMTIRVMTGYLQANYPDIPKTLLSEDMTFNMSIREILENINDCTKYDFPYRETITIKTQYGFFLTRKSAEQYLLNNDNHFHENATVRMHKLQKSDTEQQLFNMLKTINIHTEKE